MSGVEFQGDEPVIMPAPQLRAPTAGDLEAPKVGPKLQAAEWRSNVRVGPERNVLVWPRVALSALAVLCGAVYLAGCTVMSHSIQTCFCAVIVLFWAACAVATLLQINADKHALLHLSDGEDMRDLLGVAISIFQGNRLIGTDQGWMGFEFGSLLFQGLRTTFSFSSHRVTFRGFYPQHYSEWLSVQVQLALLRYSINGVEYGLRVDSTGKLDLGQRDHFRRQLISWLNSTPRTRASDVYPPVHPHPYDIKSLTATEFDAQLTSILKLTLIPITFSIVVGDDVAAVNLHYSNGIQIIGWLLAVWTITQYGILAFRATKRIRQRMELE